MKKILISFGDQKYKGSLKKLEETAINIGKVDKFIPYFQEELKLTDFWKKNSFILSRPRGAGYWIWKPYIILKTFESLEDGDIVMYSDAGVEIISDLSPLFNIAKEKDKVVFQLSGKHLNKTWTKRDCFVLTNCDEEKYWNSIQTCASYSLWAKNEENINFLKEYQKYLRDPRIVTDDINMCGKPNFLEFKDHRHDQSVLSMMTIRDGFERFRDPSQYGNEEKQDFTNSPYNQLVNHHRRKF